MKKLISFENYKKENKDKYIRIIEKEKKRTGRDDVSLDLDQMLAEDYEIVVFLHQICLKDKIVHS